MKRKRLLGGLIILVAFLFVMPLIQAVDTEIKIKTMPWHDLKVTILEPSENEMTFKSIKHLTGNADNYGDAIITYSDSVSNFDLAVDVKKNGERIIFEKFRNNYVAGESIYLEVVTEGFEIIPTPGAEEEETNESDVNETEPVLIDEQVDEETGVEESEESEEVEGESEDSITGSTVFGDEGIISKKVIYYSIGFLLLLVIAGFTVGVVRKRKLGSPENINIKKLSDLKKEKEGRIDDYEKVIADAEKKIEEAQKDIKHLRNENKIKEIEKKLRQDEEELSRLKEEMG